MTGNVRMQFPSNVIMLEAARISRASFTPANDNGPKPTNAPQNGEGQNASDAVKTVTVRKTLDKSGVAIKIKVPVSEYIGVAVSTSITEEGVLSSAIELVHPDDDLHYQVFQEIGNNDVVAEWQNWGRKLQLPLFIKSGDGELLPYSQKVDGVVLGDTNTRRRTATEANRRPRFLNRRKPGNSEAS